MKVRLKISEDPQIPSEHKETKFTSHFLTAAFSVKFYKFLYYLHEIEITQNRRN